MSRSYRKQNYHGIAGESDKQGKRLANRAFRRREQMALHTFNFDKLPYQMSEVYSVWSFPKDGKFYFGHWENHKDPWFREHFKKLKRK